MRSRQVARLGTAGAAVVMALSVAGCQSNARQDAYKQVGSVCSFMAPTVSGARNYAPAGEKEAPDSKVAYPAPDTPIYCDRPLSTSLSSIIELGNYTEALHVSGYYALLQQKGPFTVFAIPNEPMERYSARFPGGLLDPANKAALKALISYTIVPGNWTIPKLQAALAKMPTHAGSLNTLAGVPLIFTVEPGTGELVIGNAAGTINRLWVTGVPQSNGTLYFTQSALEPKAVVAAPVTTQPVAAKTAVPQH
ncbi:fasciclin domain-containing protein [Acetobacter sp.]|uniref:fasciclin domain-containing protein n=1 Tax=Acetobacter sp. TaxID=440 RepID=UPI0039ECF96D